MSDWWEHGYPGGPMIYVAGFPRPLYPPDANRYGKKPSQPGPDIVAYKRCVWRAGRWPGPASSFDDQYSNTFAHGKAGGNVADSGLAGVQRQGDIDDTGWLGKATFNLLRSIRIPVGLPNAGQPAMDATAVELINKAWNLYGGNEPAPDQKGTVREAALRKAITQIGVKEAPPDSNQCLYTDWYPMVGPWCAIFCTWCYEEAARELGKDSPAFVRGERWAYVPYIVGDARANRNGLVTTGDPIPGDLVCYDWQADGVQDHVGIFEEWTGAHTFSAIEGNTSMSNNSNGGEVMRRQRDAFAGGIVFVRVAEP